MIAPLVRQIAAEAATTPIEQAALAGCWISHPDFRVVHGHLGELSEPCAITFGRQGRPLYVAGPHDDASAVMETLRAAVDGDGFAVAA